MEKDVFDKIYKYRDYLHLAAFRRGEFSDKYFINVRDILEGLEEESPISEELNHQRGNFRYIKGDYPEYKASNAIVEMQWFTRRPGRTVVAGVELALTCLKFCTGFWQEGSFVDTSQKLSVWAVDEGSSVDYHGRPDQVMPVIRVQGRYRDFGVTETLTLGYLSRASRIATNMMEIFEATHGKNVLFFPARYDLPDVQPVDGLAYQAAIDAYNQKYEGDLTPFVSTDAQGRFIGQIGGGTIPHAAIASFLGDTVQTTLAFAEIIPPDVARVALVDFENDSVGTSIAVAREMFERYYAALKNGKQETAQKYKLFGVRLDTSAALRDVSIVELGDKKLDNGVNPRLVSLVRCGLNDAWKGWGIESEKKRIAKEYLSDIKIIVSGGFNREKIQWFEAENTPVDMYAVGSAAYDNHGITNTDFTADVVRLKIGDEWVPMAKVGRQANENPEMKRIW